MEREILIANTKTQKRSKITSSAMTLGELKADLRAKGIDYTDMTFTEGISKTQLLDDATQLPQNVMYKGQPTNNLVILLTNTKKKIASGAINRKEAYTLIKEAGLQEAVKTKFGKNFTQVSTEDLIHTLMENGVKIYDTTPKEVSKEEPKKEASTEEESKDIEEEDEYYEDEDNYTLKDFIAQVCPDTIEDTLVIHIASLAKNNAISVDELQELKNDIDNIINLLNKKEKQVSNPVSTSDGSINDDDIDDMINGIM